MIMQPMAETAQNMQEKGLKGVWGFATINTLHFVVVAETDS